MNTVSERDELAQIYSDMHKDAYGFRPRVQWQELTVAQLRAMCDELEPVIADAIDEERRAQDAAAVRFEARVADTIKSGAGDRATAVRWIAQAEDAGEDRDYLCYSLGLRFGYFS